MLYIYIYTLGLQPYPQEVVRPPKPTPTILSGGGWSPRDISLHHLKTESRKTPAEPSRKPRRSFLANRVQELNCWEGMGGRPEAPVVTVGRGSRGRRGFRSKGRPISIRLYHGARELFTTKKGLDLQRSSQGMEPNPWPVGGPRVLGC